MTVVIEDTDGRIYSMSTMDQLSVGVADGSGPNSVGTELIEGEPCIVMWPRSDPRHLPLRLVRRLDACA